MADEKDDIIFKEPFAWVPDGEHTAKCTRYTDPIPFRGTRKVFLYFELVKGPFVGTEVFMALNVGYKPVGIGSRYLKYWINANRNRPPTRNAKHSSRMFINKYYKIYTRTVIPKTGPSVKFFNSPKEKEMPEAFRYSIVDHIELCNLPDIQEDGEAYQ